MAFKRVVIFFGVIIFIIAASYLAIRFARGERFNLETKTLTPTGLLVASSVPDGASVFVDGKLKTATDDTISLLPGEYQVEIKKDGFHSWQKNLQVEEELVTKAEAHLFSSFPSLKSLTYTGASRPSISPNGQRMIYSVATASATKQGLWVLDLSDRPLGFNREPRQIIESAPRGRDFSQAEYRWSPDSKQVLVTLKDRPGSLRGQTIEENFLLDTDKLNEPTELVDVSLNLESILGQWEKEERLRNDDQISKLPNELIKAFEASVEEIIFSPNEKKLLYTATASATIPEEIIRPLPASNTQPETRKIKPGGIYVYDLVEDKNFKINIERKQPDESSQKAGFSQFGMRNLKDGIYLTWFPTSSHLLYVQENKIIVLEYDNTNWVDVYAGPFENGNAFPFPSWDKILILASLGENQPSNLYAVSLR